MMDRSSLPTRPSLLARIQDPADQAGWQEFHDSYRKLVFGIANGSGLTREEAEEVTQDVFCEVAERIAEFKCDPQRGRFRGWLMNLTRWRVADKFRRRSKHQQALVRPENETGSTPWMETIPDQVLEAEWAALERTEWQRHVLEVALARVASRVPPQHLQAFQLYRMQGWPVLRVAREMGLNPGHVYLICHRLTKSLKAEIRRAEAELGA